LPEGAEWLYELKLDGYRALAIKAAAKVQFRSRNDNDFTLRYPAIVKALASLPDETVIDREVGALDGSGRPSFNTLQNYGSFKALIPVLRFRCSDFWRNVTGITLRTGAKLNRWLHSLLLSIQPP